MKFWPSGKMSLSTKLLLGFGLLVVLPVAVVSLISIKQLGIIQEVSEIGTNKALTDTQIKHIEDLLSQEARRLSLLFFRIRDETKLLSTVAEAVLKEPDKFHYRNGSHYDLKISQRYVMPWQEGTSALFLHEYQPNLLPAIQATETLDLVWKTIASREPLMEQSWLIHQDGLSRTFPWQDFSKIRLPPGTVSRDQPYFVMAGPKMNPTGREVFTPLYYDDLLPKWMISCLSPVMVDGEHVATMGIDITLQRLLRELSEIRITEGSSSLLFSGNEIVAASDNLPLDILGLNPELPSFGQDLFASKQQQVRDLAGEMFRREELIKFVDLPRLKAYVGSALIEPLRWRIMLIVPEEDVLQPARDNSQLVIEKTRAIKNSFLSLILMVAFTAGSIVFVVLVQQSNGLRMLFQGISKFGEGHLNHLIPEDDSEFGKLGHALNAMARNLIDKHLELKKVQSEIEQERKLSAVGRLAAGIAHEINNPLATISTHTQVILRRNDIPVDASAKLKKVMDEIKRIQSNLRNLLDLSRLQSPVKTNADPNLLVREVADLIAHEASLQGVKILLQLADNSHAIPVDCSGIKQILWNLLTNAIHCQADSGGEVIIRSRFMDDPFSYILEVADHGPGIAHEVMPHIFDPFFTTKEVGQGTGLGLATVFGIVQAHGAKIEVENLKPRGACFRITFPGER